jgi:hypothetical protein
VPFAPLDLVAPAGGISSCADDLLPWLLTLLGRDHGEPTLLPPYVLSELRASRATLPGRTLFAGTMPVGYALGLFVDDYRGHLVLHHGGDIDGFTSQVSLLPEAGCAVAFLANRGGSALRDALPGMIFDRLLGLEPEPHADTWFAIEETYRAGRALERSTTPTLPLSMVRPAGDYTGRYAHPAYGSLTVTLAESGLRLSCRGLDGPLVHRHLEVFALAVDLGGSAEQIPVQFFHDLDGEVDGVEVVLDGATAPVRFGREAATPSSAELDRLAGTYRNGPLEVIVGRRGEHALTALVVQGEPAVLRHVRGLLFRLGYDRVEFTGDGKVTCVAGEFTLAEQAGG